MTTTGDAEVVHHTSHDSLLVTAAPQRDRSIDAVVVPAARPVEHLETATSLATGLEAVLVVLCSGRVTAEEVSRRARTAGALRWIAVDLPVSWCPDRALGGLRLRTAHGSFGRFASRTDLSAKRNAALLLARLAGWERLLFLDDDIREVDAGTVLKAASALVPGGAVGIPATRFEDNSVVCHANRLAGGDQDVFVSGSALVVDTTRIESFFPAVYNEDWLYLADAVAAGAVSSVGESVQLEYDPFADPERARSEEFGDVLAEGLFALRHAGLTFRCADTSYWSTFLAERTALVARIRRDLLHSDVVPADERRQIMRSLQAADRRRRDIYPDLLACYVRSWRADRGAWAAAVERLPRGLGVLGALAKLELIGRVAMSENLLPPPTSGWVSRPPGDPDVVLAREKLFHAHFAVPSCAADASVSFHGLLSAQRETQQRAAFELKRDRYVAPPPPESSDSGDVERQALLVAGGVAR